jgi:hypothetical protein
VNSPGTWKRFGGEALLRSPAKAFPIYRTVQHAGMKFDLLVWLLLVPSAEGASSDHDLVDHTGLIKPPLSLSLALSRQLPRYFRFELCGYFMRVYIVHLTRCAPVQPLAAITASVCSHLRVGHGWHEHVPDGLRADP